MPSKKEGGRAALDSDWRKTSRDMRDKFIERVSKLWDENFPQAKEILDDSETPIMKLNFTAKIDYSESEAIMDTTIRYSEVHSDGKSDTFENPRPGPELPGEPLPGVDSEARAESKKAKAKKRENKEKESSMEGLAPGSEMS